MIQPTKSRLIGPILMKPKSQLKNQISAVQTEMTSSKAAAAASPAPIASRLAESMAWSLASLTSCLASSTCLSASSDRSLTTRPTSSANVASLSGPPCAGSTGERPLPFTGVSAKGVPPGVRWGESASRARDVPDFECTYLLGDALRGDDQPVRELALERVEGAAAGDQRQ